MAYGKYGQQVPDLIPPTDGLERTDWQDPAVLPTVPGPYEVTTAGGHVFQRKFDGATWRNSVNNEASGLRMPWRGVKPGSIELSRYDATTRTFIHTNRMPVGEQHEPS